MPIRAADPAVYAVADKAMSLGFDRDKLVKYVDDNHVPSDVAVPVISMADDIATLNDTTYEVATMGIRRAHSASLDDVLKVMDAVGDAATMDDTTMQVLNSSFNAMSKMSASDVVAAIERADRSTTMDSDLLKAVSTEFSH